ncbi:uncharacterized protein BN780_01002 [Clostridium sp. CAG:780]|jgi:UDP-N-acetylmuramyl tripeptide synthase|nr:uncharacterized protein BN780_01002 [Clostridium sp. CAG:780]
MPFIEIITDTKSQMQLNKSIKKEQVNNCEILYIKEKNIDNIKNIKLETLVVNKEIEDMEKISKIIENTKNVIINLDFNKIEKQNKFISYGYNSKSDITISSIDEDEALIYIQKEITSIFGRKIEPQEVKVKLKSDINIYNIMIIIALNVLYTR